MGSLSCVNGVCQKAGLVMGEDCTNASCRVPLVCDTKSNRCVERPVRGENCSATLPCGLGLDCVEGMCVEQFSRDVGEKCGDRTCMLPLVCGTNTHTCIRASSPDTITQRRCSNTDDCPDDCECLCDWRTGTRHCSIKEAPSSNAIVLYNEFVFSSISLLSIVLITFTFSCLCDTQNVRMFEIKLVFKRSMHVQNDCLGSINHHQQHAFCHCNPGTLLLARFFCPTDCFSSCHFSHCDSLVVFSLMMFLSSFLFFFNKDE